LLLSLLLFLSLEDFLSGTVTGTGTAAGGPKPGSEKDAAAAAGACEVKTVTVSTLPVLRESELSVGSGSAGAADSRLLLFVRSDVPGAVSVLDDLDNTALPYFTLEMSGTGADISQVHWKQQWLENGTLFFHVSMSSSEQLFQATQPTAREPSQGLHEHVHLLHISVMGGLIALLLLILLFTLVLYTRQRWCRRRRAPQKSASTEATHEIHYIPSVLLGPPQSRDGFRTPRAHQHGSVIGMAIRETPILDDCDCEDDEQPGQLLDGKIHMDEDFCSQGTRSMDSLGKGGFDANSKHSLDNRVQRIKDSFRTNATMEITHFQNATHSSSTSRKRGPIQNRGGVFGPQECSSSDVDDENQLKFYTEHRVGRRRSKGCPQSPMSKTTLTLITVSTCVLAMVYGSQTSCPLTVKVTLHVPEHFVADGSSFVVSMGSYLDVSNWLNPAKLTLYHQSNSSSQWVRDYCGQRTIEPCEQLCDQDTGECSCLEGYSPDPEHTHLCIRTDWGRNEGPWPYSNLERGYDLVTGEQAPEKIFRSSYSLGQGLWLPVSKSFVVPPVELSINPVASCKTDVLVTEDPGDIREEAMMSTHFETVDDLLASFGPVRDCSRDNGGCRKNFKCVSDRRLDSTGCMCPEGLRPMKDGSGCYDYSVGTDCTDGFNGGCEQLCLQQLVPLPDDPTSNNVLMFCGCVQEYKLAADGRSCLLLADNCEGPKCPKQDSRFNDTLFSEMLHGYNNKTQEVNLGQVFQMTFRDNNFIKDFPQLADGLMVIPLPVEEQCRGVLSEPLPNLQLLTGDAQFSEGMGYPMMQQWQVRSNLYKVKLSAITLSTGIAQYHGTVAAVLTRQPVLARLAHEAGRRVARARTVDDLQHREIVSQHGDAAHTGYLTAKRASHAVNEVTEQVSRRDLKAVPFITFLSDLMKTQLLSDDLVAGVEIQCQEKGSCPAACHLCRQVGRDSPSPLPALLDVSRSVPLFSLIQDNLTKEAFKSAAMSSYWCAGKGDVIDNWCRCDLSAFGSDGLPNCSPLLQPLLRLSPHLEPSSTVVALEWIDVEPLIGYKVADYIIQHKRIEDPSEAEIYTGEVLSLVDDLFSGLGSSCVVPGRKSGEHAHSQIYSLIFKCLEPDSLYKFTLYALDSRGSRSEASYVTVRTSCPIVDDSRAEEIADRVYNLYNGYTSGKEQQTAYNTLMEIPPPTLYRVQHHYNSHYEKFGDFVWRSEDELGPRKAHLILRRVDRISLLCRSLLRSGYIQSRTESMPYVMCRSEDMRLASSTWHSSLHETPLTCVEKILSVQRNIYGKSKLR
ncbi:astrotactin-1 isoform X2, partial [Silurus meridionalis]